jgi:hypothetical protein
MPPENPLMNFFSWAIEARQIKIDIIVKIKRFIVSSRLKV